MSDFLPEQKRWLEGYVSGAAAMRGLRPLSPDAPSAPAPSSAASPDAALLLAQDRPVRAGKKLADQEKWKRAEHPLDAYARMREQAIAGNAPNPDDNFRWRYHGLFYVAPTQTSFMCRLRIPNGILSHWQFAAIADLSERFGGGFAHVTTRANLQIREIAPQRAPLLLEALNGIGIVPRGSGADNIRNVTGSATAGIDPVELLDTRDHASAWHHYILNDRALFGLPRKFNVAFDGAGLIPTLEDTNDIGFQAVKIADGAPVEPGVYYRLTLGGITGHKDFARDVGVILPPKDAVKAAAAVVRVYLEHGDRTERTRARLKYLLDDWGLERFLVAVEERFGEKFVRLDSMHLAERPNQDRMAHIGVHRQKQVGCNWIGLVLPLGKLTADEMRGLAALAHDFGDGDIRLTVWQNLLISGVPDAVTAEACARIEALGLDWKTGPIRAGLVACTGSKGCKFANSDTKGDALKIVEHIEERLDLDLPVNIHLTGCPNSCAQHYIGDIGLVGAKIAASEEEQGEGYHLYVGGGFGRQARIARLIHSDVAAQDAPLFVEGLLRAYLERRAGPTENFYEFAGRHDVDALKIMASERQS